LTQEWRKKKEQSWHQLY